MYYVGDRLTVERVEGDEPAGVGYRLEGDTAHGGMFDAKLHDWPDLVVVHAFLDSRHKDYVELGLGQPV